MFQSVRRCHVAPASPGPDLEEDPPGYHLSFHFQTLSGRNSDREISFFLNIVFPNMLPSIYVCNDIQHAFCSQ